MIRHVPVEELARKRQFLPREPAGFPLGCEQPRTRPAQPEGASVNGSENGSPIASGGVSAAGAAGAADAGESEAIGSNASAPECVHEPQMWLSETLRFVPV